MKLLLLLAAAVRAQVVSLPAVPTGLGAAPVVAPIQTQAHTPLNSLPLVGREGEGALGSLSELPTLGSSLEAPLGALPSSLGALTSPEQGSLQSLDAQAGRLGSLFDASSAPQGPALGAASEDIASLLRVPTSRGSRRKGRVSLRGIDTRSTPGVKNRKRGEKVLKKEGERLAALQDKLMASKERGVLVVLQAMDGGGKDGTVKHVFGYLNPVGLDVHSFKKPTEDEARHDFLWRIHPKVPAKGRIGVFNRSHYEDILVPTVFQTFSKKEILRRYKTINEFERQLVDSGITVVKLFLHISKDEQKERLETRLEERRKHWKFDPSDLEMRKRWPEFQKVYGKILARTSTPWAPWYVVPADRKWYRNAAIARILRETLESMGLDYPKLPKNLRGLDIP